MYPEFLTDRDPSEAVAVKVLEFLNDPGRSDAVRKKLDQLCDKVARPGACTAAARIILAVPTRPRPVSTAHP